MSVRLNGEHVQKLHNYRSDDIVHCARLNCVHVQELHHVISYDVLCVRLK